MIERQCQQLIHKSYKHFQESATFGVVALANI